MYYIYTFQYEFTTIAFDEYQLCIRSDENPWGRCWVGIENINSYIQADNWLHDPRVVLDLTLSSQREQLSGPAAEFDTLLQPYILTKTPFTRLEDLHSLLPELFI